MGDSTSAFERRPRQKASGIYRRILSGKTGGGKDVQISERMTRATFEIAKDAAILDREQFRHKRQNGTCGNIKVIFSIHYRTSLE